MKLSICLLGFLLMLVSFIMTGTQPASQTPTLVLSAFTGIVIIVTGYEIPEKLEPTHSDTTPR